MVGDQPTQLPGIADADGPDPIIVHVDMDCFYAACERLRHPYLNGEPFVIGMKPHEQTHISWWDPFGHVAEYASF